jgi:dTDP-glucose 4,6-dehydratase
MTSSLSDLRLTRSGRTTGFCSKFKEELGGCPVWQFGRGLETTMRWHRDNPAWLEQVRSGQFLEYLNRHHNQKEAAIGN